MRFVKDVPQAPFMAQVQLAIDVLDSDGVDADAGPLGIPVTFGTADGIP